MVSSRFLDVVTATPHGCCGIGLESSKLLLVFSVTVRCFPISVTGPVFRDRHDFSGNRYHLKEAIGCMSTGFGTSIDW